MAHIAEYNNSMKLRDKVKKVKAFSMDEWLKERDSRRRRLLRGTIFMLKHPFTWLMLTIIIVYGFGL